MLDSAFEIDFEEESKRDYSQLTEEEKAKTAMAFISNVCQIHPFREGNTRTFAVFAIDYFSDLGFHIDNSLFEKHSTFFRDALIRDNCRREWQTSYYLDCFTENLLLNGDHDLENMSLIIDTKN